MITRQKYDERLLCHQFVFEIRLLFPAKEGDIKLATLEVVGQRCRVVARNPDFDTEQVVAQDVGSTRQPIDFLPGLGSPSPMSGFGRSRGGAAPPPWPLPPESAPTARDRERRAQREVHFDAVHAAIHPAARRPRIRDRGFGGSAKAVRCAVSSRPRPSGFLPPRPRQNSEGGVAPYRRSISAKYASELTKSFSRTLGAPNLSPTEPAQDKAGGL